MTRAITAGERSPAIPTPDAMRGWSDLELAEATLYAFWARSRILAWSGRMEDLPRLNQITANAERRFAALYVEWLRRHGIVPREEAA